MHLWLRSVLPTAVDEVVGSFNQFLSRSLQGFQGRLLPVQRMHPGIVAHAVTCLEPGRQPFHVGLFYQVQYVEQIFGYLLAYLDRVAAIDKNRGGLAQHDDHACRAGETTDPAQAFIVFRNVLTQVLIRPRNNQRGKIHLEHLSPNGLQAPGDFLHVFHPVFSHAMSTTRLPRMSIRGVIPNPGSSLASMKPCRRCGAPSAVLTVT